MPRRYLLLVFAATLVACGSAPGHGDEAGSAPAISAASASVALEAYHWDLTGATDQRGQAIASLQPVAGKPLRLDFTKGRIGVSGGCNRIGGDYEYRGTTLQLQPLAQTQMACADRRLMDADAAITERLHGELQAKIDAGAPPRLQLLAANGDRLVFEGTPTPQARFGGEGTTVFFEVGPQRMPCPHPLIRDMQCLQVRERVYADDGTLSSQGEWQPLYQEIEGYTHAPGTRNVLRLKRFTVKNPPPDASAVAYVLDMVVESEIVEAAK